MRAHLDWRHAKVADEAASCVICGKPALLRSPERGVPCHKTCAERWHRERQERQR